MDLSTGKVAFPITFDNGDIEYIYINPRDPKLTERMNKFTENVKKRLSQIDIGKYTQSFDNDIAVKLNSIEDFEKLTDEELQKLSEMSSAVHNLEVEYQQQVCDEIDAIFDSDVSSKVFKYVSPLEYVERTDKAGEYEPYMMQFLRALEAEIMKYNSNINAAMQRHIGKYIK